MFELFDMVQPHPWLTQTAGPRAVILLYHRLGSPAGDLNCVSERNFRQQVEAMSEYRMLTVAELVRQLTAGPLEQNTLVVTFDDGYEDSYSCAVPILSGLPATFFVVFDEDSQDKPFPWQSKDSSHCGRRLTADQIVRMSRMPSVEIGSHSRTHPKLSLLSEGEQQQEIAGSKSQLENLLGTGVESFAYPFGTTADYNEQSKAIAQQAGYTSACCNFPDVVWPGTNRFALPRLVVRDCDGLAFQGWLASWLNN